MEYRDMDINSKINLKGTYQQFLNIAVNRFQDKQEKVIYRTRQGGKNPLKRSRTLFDSFSKSFSVSSSGDDSLRINFMMYGRFIDMGVGRGVNMNSALLRKRYRLHVPHVPRKPLRWYSRTKSHQEKRLAEIMAARFGEGMVQLAETLLNNSVPIM